MTIVNKCLICGKEFSARTDKIAKGLSKYCSKRCSNKARNEQVNRKCKVCGESFATHRCYLERGGGKYCSHHCYFKDHRGANVIQFWKGGITPPAKKARMGAEYRKWHETVYARDNWTCQECGDSRGGNLHAHHIFSFADFAEHRLAVWNGVTLCVPCHQKLHPEIPLSVVHMKVG